MKIWAFDIETSPHFSAHFGRWKQNIPPEHTLIESEVICWAGKWIGEAKTDFMSSWDHGFERMINGAWNKLDEADAVVHFNGKKFDVKRLNAEFIRLGWDAPSPYQQVDLLQQVKKNFAFSSNRLKHVLKEMGLTPKLEDNSNMQLWIDVVWNETKAAQERMRKYNIQDVKSTEELYNWILGWIQPHPNWGLFVDDMDAETKPICPNCGSLALIKKGVETTNVRTYQRWKCKDCGKHSRGRKHIGLVGVDNGILKP